MTLQDYNKILSLYGEDRLKEFIKEATEQDCMIVFVKDRCLHPDYLRMRLKFNKQYYANDGLDIYRTYFVKRDEITDKFPMVTEMFEIKRLDYYEHVGYENKFKRVGSGFGYFLSTYKGFQTDDDPDTMHALHGTALCNMTPINAKFRVGEKTYYINTRETFGYQTKIDESLSPWYHTLMREALVIRDGLLQEIEYDTAKKKRPEDMTIEELYGNQ